MKLNDIGLRTRLTGVALAVAMIAVGCANTAREDRPNPGEAMVTVHPSVPKAAAEWSKRKEEDRPLWIQLVVKRWNNEGYQRFIANYDDPRSPNYLEALSDEEFQRRFWPPLDKIQALVDWLQSQGFEVTKSDTIGLTAVGTVGVAEEAFATTIVESPDASRYANNTAPQVPARFADVVDGVYGLDNTRLMLLPCTCGPNPCRSRFSGGLKKPAQ